MGLDFNSELAEAISKVRGANYFSVHTPGEFRRRLVDQFDFAVRWGHWVAVGGGAVVGPAGGGRLSCTAAVLHMPALSPPACPTSVGPSLLLLRSPLVFDLALQVDAASLAGGDGWRILHVYGSPNPNDTALSGDGTVMRVG